MGTRSNRKDSAQEKRPNTYENREEKKKKQNKKSNTSKQIQNLKVVKENV